MSGHAAQATPSLQSEKVASEFLLKAVDLVLLARTPTCLAASASRNRWFHIETQVASSETQLFDAWRSDSTASPLVLEVFLQHRPDTETLTPETEALTLLERWVWAHEPVATSEGTQGDAASSPRTSSRPSLFESERSLEVPVIYKRAVIFLRSLYVLLRTLPAHRLFLSSTRDADCSFSLVFRLSAPTTGLREGFATDDCSCFEFTPVETPIGRLTGAVAYRHKARRRVLALTHRSILTQPCAAPMQAAVSALEVIPIAQPRVVIPDYVSAYSEPAAPRAVVPARRSSWSLSGRTLTPRSASSLKLSPPAARVKVSEFVATSALVSAVIRDSGNHTPSRGTAPVSIPRRPSESYLDRAEQHMGGSPHSASERRPFAATSLPRPSMLTPAAGSHTSETALGFYGGRASARASPPSAKPLSVSPQLPFAFTPQPHSSLSSGLHPLAQRPSPPSVGSYGGEGARFLLAVRRPSWSLASSLALSSSLAGMSLLSAAHDSTGSLATSSGFGTAQHFLLQAGASSPDDGPGVDGEEQEQLPFALDGDADQLTEQGGISPSSLAHAQPFARSDAAVGALVRLLQEAPPVRAATGCSLNDALRELERYRASSRGSSG